MRPRTLQLIAAACLIPACGGEELTPADVAGLYILRTIEGQALPQLLHSGIECDYTVTRGDLDLGTDSSFEINLDQILDCTRGGGELSEVGRLTVGTYEVSGTRLILTAVSSDIRELQARASDEAVTAQLPVLSGSPSTKEFTFTSGP